MLTLDAFRVGNVLTKSIRKADNKMTKGDAFITKDEKKIYCIVGRWGNDIVLASTDNDSDEVLVRVKYY